VGTELRVALEAQLERLGIPYGRFDHAPVFTCDQATAAIPDASSVQTKNLFLRDKRGRRHLLLVTSCDKAIDIKTLATQAGADHLSFASPERLMKYLGVEPGSVTVLGLMHDERGAVELYVDADVWHAPLWRCHPLVNSATLVIARVDLERFFEHTGHVPRVLTLDGARTG
jgi:Ala-tRNA(Pro) deacylase